jgi:LEA14-like dessication related protein
MATSSDLVNFKIIQGDTFTLVVTCKNPDGTPINLTGYSILFRVNNEFGGRVVCVEGTTINGGVTITNASGGIFKVEVSSKNFTIPKCAYQIKIAPSGADIELNGTTLGIGYFSVEKGNI